LPQSRWAFRLSYSPSFKSMTLSYLVAESGADPRRAFNPSMSGSYNQSVMIFVVYREVLFKFNTKTLSIRYCPIIEQYGLLSITPLCKKSLH
jgi:hypothetical protein